MRRVKDGRDRRAPGDAGTRDGLADDEAVRATHPKIRGRRGGGGDRRTCRRRPRVLRTKDALRDGRGPCIGVVRIAKHPEAGPRLGQRDIRSNELRVKGVITCGSTLQHHRSQVGRPDNGDGRSVTEDQRGVVGHTGR